MSHPEQLAFFATVARRNSGLLKRATVLEIGSYDVNGSIRKVFSAGGDYIGVDLTDGPRSRPGRVRSRPGRVRTRGRPPRRQL